MIPSEYIKTFLPIHELEEIQPTGQNVAHVSNDDLLLMSQVSAYASDTGNAVTVSKKISYGTLMHKMSADFNLSSMKIDVGELSNEIIACSAAISTTSSALCNEISLSANALSSYSNELCGRISSEVSNSYVKKYNGNYNVVCMPSTDVGTKILTSFSVADGKINDISSNYQFLSDLIAAKDWQLAYGGIAGDVSKTSTVTLAGNSCCYAVLSDCYLNCNISAYEDDSYSALQILLSTNVDGTPTSSLYQTLNNPGGFSGKKFFNNYHFTIPIKAFQTSNGSATSVIVKYENDNNTFGGNSVATFTEYCFYAVPAKSELSGYVKKLTSPLFKPEIGNTVYKIRYDASTGQITSATSAYYGVATSENLGLVKANATKFLAPNYGLNLSSDYAYVEIPAATSSEVGTIALKHASDGSHYNENDSSKFLKCGLEKDNNSRGIVFMPEATNEKYGVVKLSANAIDYGNTSKDAVSSYVGVNDNGHAYVALPIADGEGKPGLVKTSIPDTSVLRIVRNVYLNDDGFAQVNVVNQPGIGLFNGGYTLSVELVLSNATSTSAFHEAITQFDGTAISCSDFGDYIFSSISSVNGWFTASLVYMGVGSNEYTQDNSCLQIVCNNVIVTTLNISQIQGAPGKKFCYSTCLGVFNSSANPNRLFAAISNAQQFGTSDNVGKLYFLIKEMNPVES